VAGRLPVVTSRDELGSLVTVRTGADGDDTEVIGQRPRGEAGHLGEPVRAAR
jgi:hypothetical protein